MSGLPPPPPPPPGGYNNGYQQPGAPRYQTQSYPQAQAALPPPPRPGAQSDPMQMPPPPARANLISANYSNQAMITQGNNMYGANYANASGMLAPPASQPPGGGMMPPPPPSSGPKVVDPRDKVLFDMQKLIFHFYCQVDQSKVDKAVFALALQLWWDEGLIALNQVLKAKYGKTIQSEDILDDFDRDGNDVTIMPVADLNASAGHQHPLFKTMLRTNNADYFNADREKNEENFRISFNKRRTHIGQNERDSWPAMGPNLRPPQFTTSVNLTNTSPLRQMPMMPDQGNQMQNAMSALPPGHPALANPKMLQAQQSQFSQPEVKPSRRGKKRNETEKERRRRKRKEKERKERERRKRKDRKKNRKKYDSDEYDSESD